MFTTRSPFVVSHLFKHVPAAETFCYGSHMYMKVVEYGGKNAVDMNNGILTTVDDNAVVKVPLVVAGVGTAMDSANNTTA